MEAKVCFKICPRRPFSDFPYFRVKWKFYLRFYSSIHKSSFIIRLIVQISDYVPFVEICDKVLSKMEKEKNLFNQSNAHWVLELFVWHLKCNFSVWGCNEIMKWLWWSDLNILTDGVLRNLCFKMLSWNCWNWNLII